MLRQTMRVIGVTMVLPILTLIISPDGASAQTTCPASIDHLSTPAIYDNAQGTTVSYGQTFVAVSETFLGVRVFIGDPTRPDDPTVGPLQGHADLVLYDATNLSAPIELGRSEVVPAGATISGEVDLLLASPLSTVISTHYFFAIATSAGFGIGLTGQFSSTYAAGNEAVRDNTTGIITENPLGRDLSFRVYECKEKWDVTWTPRLLQRC